MIRKIMRTLGTHKLITIVCLLLALGGGYYGYQKFNSTKVAIRYITAKAEKGVLVSAISGTGQVLPSSQVDIKSQASGNIIVLNTKNGQTVKQGYVLVRLDNGEAAISVSQAKTSLDIAQLTLDKLIAPPTETTLITNENSLQKAKDDLEKTKLSKQITREQTVESKKQAENNLAKSYEDSFNAVANAYLDLPTLSTGIYNIIFGTDIAKNEGTIGSGSANYDSLINTISYQDSSEQDKLVNYIQKSKNSYTTAKNNYDSSYASYKSSNRYSDNTIIDNLLKTTLETMRKESDMVKDTINMLDFWINYRTTKNLSIFSQVTTFQSDLSNYTSKINSHLSTLLNISSTIQNYKDSITNADRSLKQMDQNDPLEIAQAERSIREQELKLMDLRKGPEALDIESQKLTIQQKKNDLWSAQQKLANFSVRAPFDGIIANINLQKGDALSSGANVCTIITNQKIAQITLNELDVAKVKLGQRVTLAFDAIDGLNITGEVAEIDSLGTISQGVVSYNVKIAFDVQDDRVKPNMSVSASIILDSKPDVLMVPSSALKSQGGSSYVEILVNGVPQKKTVTIGSNNDTETEIINGINEGDDVVTQTINTGSAVKTTATIGGQQGQGGNNAFRLLR